MSSGSTSTATRMTQDKVVRREFRLAEGDAFNSFQVKRSHDRINSLGFFQEKFEIEQKPGSRARPRRARSQRRGKGDRRAVAVGGLFEPRALHHPGLDHASAISAARARTVRASVDYSSYSKSVELGFTEPYLFDKNIAVGVDIFRRDYNSFNYLGDDAQHDLLRRSTTGFQLRAGVPLTEYLVAVGALRPDLRRGHARQEHLFADFDGDGVRRAIRCSPAVICAMRSASASRRSLGYSLVYDSLNNRLRPTARPARRAQPGFRRARRRRALYPHRASRPPNIGMLGQRLHLLARRAKAATSRRSKRAAARASTRSASPTASISASRRSAASTFAASARACPRSST